MRMRADVRDFCLLQYALFALICLPYKSQCRCTSEQFLNFGDFFKLQSVRTALYAKVVRVGQAQRRCMRDS